VKEFNPRELEKALRDEGFSWASATKAVALFRDHLRDGGANVEIGPRDEDAATQTATLAAALRKLESTLRA
jgi:single-stranded DNA-specific DHH superfamily exonuclease